MTTLHEESKPYLLIVAGPTGSGKGSLPTKVQKYLKLSNNTVNVIIDDLVEENKYYKEQVKKFIESKKDKGETDEEIIKLFTNPNEELLKTFNTFYYTAREKTNCITGKLLNDKNNMSCDSINDKKLKDAFKKKSNIVFETAGLHWPVWLFEMSPIIKEYDIIMAYSIVELCELLKRNITRALTTIRGFIPEFKGKAPRLPDIKQDRYVANLKIIVDTFKKRNIKCSDKSLCIRFIIFDNNTSTSKLLYNSNIHKTKVGNNAINGYKIETDTKCSVDVTSGGNNTIGIKGINNILKKKTVKKDNKEKKQKNKTKKKK